MMATRALSPLQRTAVPLLRRNLSTTTTSSTTSPIQIFHDVPPLRHFRRDLLLSKRSVGLVPTMGALHSGHLRLARMAASENTDVFISIYVNPTQFGLNEDLSSYPKTWEKDLSLLNTLNTELSTTNAPGRITAIFAPSTKTMYPTTPPDSSLPGKGTFITLTPISTLLEGASRPVFFRGVATVCTKLFNICTPDRVYFGQKDIQQTVVIKKLVKDLHIDTNVRIAPTEREADGLALSSRNVYLGSRRRKVAPVLYNALKKAAQQYKDGKRKRGDILWPANEHVDGVVMEQEGLPANERALLQVDYISLADPETLEEVDVVDETRGAVLSGAIKMMPVEELGEGEDGGVGEGKIAVRLIDNIVLEAVG